MLVCSAVCTVTGFDSGRPQPIRLVPERPDGPETAGTYIRRSGGISAAFRITLITASTAVAFGPAIWTNIRTILDGAPTAYLLLAPL